MFCPRCKGANVCVYPVTEEKIKHRGCVGWFFWILLAVLTCGLILIIPAITNTRSKIRTYSEAICQGCGKRWKVR